ncbi:hypothetical protein ASE92_07820 [Pedobacter sp. Leaf41]|nr:hypothetical protein ASE92_07820 [Pedobacter sp. Leaf41]
MDTNGFGNATAKDRIGSVTIPPITPRILSALNKGLLCKFLLIDLYWLVKKSSIKYHKRQKYGYEFDLEYSHHFFYK